MEIPSAFEQKVQGALGEAGAAWLDALPSLVARLSDRWRFTLGRPFALSYNYVATAHLHDGSEAVLKVGPPWGDGELEREIEREIHALRLYGGRGTCRLL